MDKIFYLFIERTRSKYRLYIKVREGEKYLALTGIHEYSFPKLSKAYSTNSGFFRDFKSSVKGVISADLDELRGYIREAILDVQTGEVELTQPIKVEERDEESSESFVLDMDADIQGILRPSSTVFHSDTDYVIFEPCWLPYTNPESGMSRLFPTLLSLTNKGFQVVRYTDNIQIGPYFISGAFPSSDLETLITINGVKDLMKIFSEKMDISHYISEVDDEISEAFKQHLSLDEIKSIIVKRWIQGTYFFAVMGAFPILNIMGPSESGKTRLGLCLTSMSYHGEPTLDITEAGIFRAKEELKPTIVIDEAEYLSDPESHKKIKLLINASYAKGLGFVHRYDDFGGARVRVKFDLYSPMSIIAIKPLIGITASRSVAISMERTDSDMSKASGYKYKALRDKLYALKFTLSPEVWRIYNTLDITEYVTARFDELFRPMFTMTKIFGTDEEYNLIGIWAKRYQKNFRVSAINIARERDLLLVLRMMIYDEEKHRTFSGEEYIKLKTLAEEMAIVYNTKFTSQNISSILRTLGFEDRRRFGGADGGLTFARVSKDAVERTMLIYGIISKSDGNNE